MNSFLETFDYFIDDLLSSDADLLNGELDVLIFQELFDSFDLVSLESTDSINNDSLAA